MFRSILNFFRAPPTPTFLQTHHTTQNGFPAIDPEQAKRDSRVATLRAQIERECANFPEDLHKNCKQYGEHVIGQLNRNEVTLSTAFALIRSYATRQTNRLARPLTVVKG